ncbi:SAM-dependent methyltransferase [Constrictibacter sp. MBR-5]|jgi:ArsR family transcriptional regulator|uniref:ArsR/SmtB family transcription factor n=1 Tax=Constrictibacter sp. MBR-5 TaxID=3156467 RepID=UPI003392C3EB
MDDLLTGLRAAAEPTRLRILALCALGELSVTELTHILSQSQPRVSRHLKLLCDAGLLERYREGNWMFHRIAPAGAGADLARALVALLPADTPDRALDLERLEAIRRSRSEAAAAYFRRNAREWDVIRALHIDETEVERRLVALLPEGPIRSLLDIGTGTGRVLELMAPHVDRATGIDLSREMLTLARDRVGRGPLTNCSVRQADMYRLPVPGGSFDVVTIHQVLHFAQDPALAIAEAGRVLRPGGRLLVVDFARHDLEYLRSDHAHRRLGFGDEEIAGWVAACGLRPAPPIHLPGEPLTVTIWIADRPAAAEAARGSPNQRRDLPVAAA